METHKMLKEICDVIGYEFKIYGRKINEREIIFTDKFILKLGIYQLNNEILTNGCDILNNLDNPTLYLYNTLELGEK